MVNNLVIIGPAWPFRGSLAAFDEKIATTFLEKGIPSRIETFSLQYPNFLFPGKTQFRVEKKPTNIIIDISINSINPFNWIKVGLQLRKAKPSLIIVRYWLPFLAPCLGTICRIARSNQITKVIAIVDNMIPHEKRIGDTAFTKYFAASVDGFLTMSEKVKKDVQLFSSKPIIISPHPIFDYFGSTISKEEVGTTMSEQHTVLCPYCNRVDCTYTKIGTLQCILHCKDCGDIHGVKETFGSKVRFAIANNRLLNVIKSIGKSK
jgi:hypothetical protein